MWNDLIYSQDPFFKRNNVGHLILSHINPLITMNIGPTSNPPDMAQ